MIKNYAKFDSQTIFALFGDKSIHNFSENLTTSGVSTDSRHIEPGNIFIAIKGDTFDGNEKALDAINNGSSLVIISKEFYLNNTDSFNATSFLAVEDTLNALHLLAIHHRSRFEKPVIAIGGANGKTTTKELTATGLSSRYNVLKTEGNFNNQIGVPLTLLGMNETHQIAVIEIGTNEPGEIAVLCEIVQPTAGLITNIGKEHLEKLIDLDGVEFEETFLYGYLKNHGGIAFVNYDDERLKKYTKILDKYITYGLSEGSLLLAKISLNEFLNPIITISKDGEEFTVNMQTTGFVTGLNAIASIAVCLEYGISPEEIKYSLGNYKADDSHNYGRMRLQQKNGRTIINDCYNANPDSMRVAVDSLVSFNSESKKVAVLGDMRELGDASENEHLILLNYASSQIEQIYITGDNMLKAFSKLNCKNITHFIDKKELADSLITNTDIGDIILIKGSRGMEMEKIISFI